MSVYDGSHHLGDVRGSKATGFTALTPEGAHVGTFATVRAACDALSHRAGDGT